MDDLQRREFHEALLALTLAFAALALTTPTWPLAAVLLVALMAGAGLLLRP